ncbi:hypothetical protein [Brevibacillus parabrevis]|uniref:hypothetical protein n=1 Tax=Brevibacillus parabrevis TaxID=54914 RepID=UPI002E21A383|nr:hypothetical protein [Brevibacillus parabrevis]
MNSMSTGRKILNSPSFTTGRVILVAGSGDFSQGFDTPADLNRVPEKFNGGI